MSRDNDSVGFATIFGVGAIIGEAFLLHKYYGQIAKLLGTSCGSPLHLVAIGVLLVVVAILIVFVTLKIES